MRLREGLFTLLILLAVPAAAEVVTTIHLTDVPDVMCDEVFQIDGIDMYFTTTTYEDCDGGGSCNFGIDPGIGIWLFPGRFVVDFGEDYDVTRVEIDIIDYCGIGCTQAFLYNDGAQVAYDGNDLVSQQDMLVLVPSRSSADMLAISSCEGEVLGDTIRIYADALAFEKGSWGEVKALFR